METHPLMNRGVIPRSSTTDNPETLKEITPFLDDVQVHIEEAEKALESSELLKDLRPDAAEKHRAAIVSKANESLESKLKGSERRLGKKLEEAEQAVRRATRPPLEKTDREALLDELRNQEARQLLQGMKENERIVAIHKAIENGSLRLLHAAEEAIIPLVDAKGLAAVRRSVVERTHPELIEAEQEARRRVELVQALSWDVRRHMKDLISNRRPKAKRRDREA